jgi:hypothetical protein
MNSSVGVARDILLWVSARLRREADKVGNVIAIVHFKLKGMPFSEPPHFRRPVNHRFSTK